MSLTADDLQQIRTIVREEVREEVRGIISVEVTPRLDNLEGRVTAVENDVKEIYFILSPASSS